MLFEGIKMNGEHVALISYPRTDSTRIAEDFASEAKKYIIKKYGTEYYEAKDFEAMQKKSKNAKDKMQDAHEGIRVIDISLTPDDIKNKVDHDEYSLYKLI
ncbi:hypothetical protein FACS189496_4420 [Bacilli bacterium]|nr:hypothetical protein FACS189496_4420 [Bacilli bacterium]